jgi:putative 4-mercaptohistidine N1-methyltranferase
VFGNVWQWQEDHFHQLHGGGAHPYYNDFSVPCYDGEHQMILGGSFASCGDEASVWARFHFRPHFFQHAGFRIARSAQPGSIVPKRLVRRDANAHYENEVMLGRYLHMHYAPLAAQIPPGANNAALQLLPLRCAEIMAQYASGKQRALDVGCAVGRSAFELTRDFAEVIGIDLSQRFIDSAKQLQRGEQLHYTLPITGSKTAAHSVQIAADIMPGRVQFATGDAMHLSADLQNFDAILIANTICRLPDPGKCLRDLLTRLSPNGVLVVVSPYSWFAEFTPPEKWVEGKQVLAEILGDCELLHDEDIAFTITEHARKYEYIVSNATVWRKL